MWDYISGQLADARTHGKTQPWLDVTMSHLIIINYLLTKVVVVVVVVVCARYQAAIKRMRREVLVGWLVQAPGWWSILVSRGRYCLFVCHDCDCYKYLTHLLADTSLQSGLFNSNIPTSSHQAEKSGEKLIPPVCFRIKCHQKLWRNIWIKRFVSENSGLKYNKNGDKNTFKHTKLLCCVILDIR